MSEDLKECPHLNQIKVLRPPTNDVKGCVDCLKSGDPWETLRICKTCGYIGCCDNSKNQHMTKHFKSSGHPLIQSVQPNESWYWCNTCQLGWEVEYFEM